VKSSIDDLAIFGGLPAFDQKLHVGRPNIGDRRRLLERINDSLDGKWLTNDGPHLQEFERRIAERVGAKHCIATCNATLALEIIIRAAGLSGEVIVPSFTFIATAHALQWQGITPVFCDVDPRTHNIDPSQVERMITPSTKGIIGVHLWGRPCEIDTLAGIARRYNLKLLFDAAHAFGCSYKGQPVGNFGHAEVFSFHATKVFNSFEGGAVVTNDEELATKTRLMRNFGFADYDNVVLIGTNGKMNEASAAMGLTSLESLEEFVANNHRNYERYRRQLVDVPGVELIAYGRLDKGNYWYIVLEIDEGVTLVSRDQLQQILWAENVLARRYFYPGCHRMEPYNSYFPKAGLLLPNTEHLVRRVLSLPNGTAVGADEINHICEIIRLAVLRGDEVRERLVHSAAEAATDTDDWEAPTNSIPPSKTGDKNEG
jgi:dTDP-4-amino-4,6-dideoxygalactose transaminase